MGGRCQSSRGCWGCCCRRHFGVHSGDCARHLLQISPQHCLNRRHIGIQTDFNHSIQHRLLLVVQHLIDHTEHIHIGVVRACERVHEGWGVGIGDGWGVSGHVRFSLCGCQISVLRPNLDSFRCVGYEYGQKFELVLRRNHTTRPIAQTWTIQESNLGPSPIHLFTLILAVPNRHPI